MKIGIVVFPGSNCDRDMHDAISQYLGEPAIYLWHDTTDLQNVDAVILPGGFSYGDHLRAGAIAKFAPIMAEVKTFADKGGPVVGVCNGFQILTESGLLPGALRRNESLSFRCQQAELKVEKTHSLFAKSYTEGQVITLPIAHAEGNYYADAETIQRLEDNHQVVFRYVTNPNGAVNDIAGICNEKGNVLGMMPHPERALIENEIFTTDGRGVFDGLKQALALV